MNSECFLIKSLILLSSKNSKLSDLRTQIILVPLVNLSLSVSSTIVNVPPAADSHLYYLSS